jgi:hypothetical protein
VAVLARLPEALKAGIVAMVKATGLMGDNLTN